MLHDPMLKTHDIEKLGAIYRNLQKVVLTRPCFLPNGDNDEKSETGSIGDGISVLRAFL